MRQDVLGILDMMTYFLEITSDDLKEKIK